MLARVLAGAVLFSLFLAGCSSKPPPEPFWIGHLAPLSGTEKTRGVPSQRGVQLAAEEPSARELRVLGRPLAVRHVDTHGDAETARAEAVRLIAVNKAVALLVDAGPAAAERVGREARQYGVPVLVLGELASPPGDNVFVVGAGPEARGRALAQFATDGLPVESIVVLSDARSALAAALGSAFARQCRKTGKPAIREGEYLNEQEFKDQVSRVVRDKPGAVLLAGTLADLHRLRAELQTAQVAIPVLFGGEDVGTALLGDEARDGPELYVATAFTAEGESEAGRDFARRYREAFGERPDLPAALAYDGTRLLYEAIRQAGTVNGGRIREQLAKVSGFESVTGKFAFQEHQARRPVFVVRLKGGAATLVKTLPPEE